MGAHGQFNRTPHQVEMMEVILAAADQGEFLDVYEIQRRVSFGRPHGTKEQIRSDMKQVIEALKKWGFVVMEHRVDPTEFRRRRRMFAVPTALAYQRFRKTPSL